MDFTRPLSWPADVPRTRSRRSGRFKIGGSNRLTVAQAFDRLSDELDRFEGRRAELSADFEQTRTGRPSLSWKRSADPGCVVLFTRRGKDYCLPCDTYDDLAQNIAAIAAHLDAVRAIERHGVATVDQMMGAFVALPAPRQWFDVLGVRPDSPLEVAEAAYRSLARDNHPDVGGDADAMSEINAAMQIARESLK